MASPDTTSSSDSAPNTLRTLISIPLELLASLKLTVLLFALGIFIVLAGTLAQT